MTMRLLALAFCALLLVACGGGGSGGNNSGGNNNGGTPPVDQPPASLSVNAGPDQTVDGGSQVTLQATLSGTDQILWEQIAGDGVVLQAPGFPGDLTIVTFTAPNLGTDSILVFAATATGSGGNTATDSVQVLVRASQSAQVETIYGTIAGSVQDGLRIFKGVRFAASPAGELRFKPPQPPAFVGGVTQTTIAGPQCVQLPFPAREWTGAWFGSEDCLFLNIWAPDDEATHPVMVFFHGGTSNGLDGAALAAKTGMIIVAPNRRVGVFGTLVLQELMDESPDHGAGNYRVMDAIAALEWVQDNIAAFGGDPQRVLITGASAGGSIACGLFAAPAAQGLFRAAALISPLCSTRYIADASVQEYSPWVPLAEFHAPLLEAINCSGAADKLACLRETAPELLLEKAVGLPKPSSGHAIFGEQPVIDGIVVTANPFGGLANQVAGSFPLIAGSTTDEVRSLVSLEEFSLSPDLNDDGYRAYLADTYGAQAADQLYALYPPADYPAPIDALYMLLSDQSFGCGPEAMMQAVSPSNAAYLYQLTRGLSPSAYAVHGLPTMYLFEQFAQFNVIPDAAVQDIVAALQSAWSSFVSAPQLAPLVDAGAFGTFVWPAYDTNDVHLVDYGEPVAIANAYRGGRCVALWSILPP